METKRRGNYLNKKDCTYVTAEGKVDTIKGATMHEEFLSIFEQWDNLSGYHGLSGSIYETNDIIQYANNTFDYCKDALDEMSPNGEDSIAFDFLDTILAEDRNNDILINNLMAIEETANMDKAIADTEEEKQIIEMKAKRAIYTTLVNYITIAGFFRVASSNPDIMNILSKQGKDK